MGQLEKILSVFSQKPANSCKTWAARAINTIDRWQPAEHVNLGPSAALRRLPPFGNSCISTAASSYSYTVSCDTHLTHYIVGLE